MAKNKRTFTESDVAHDAEEIRRWLASLLKMLESLPLNENREKVEEWCKMRQTTLEMLEELITSIQTWRNRVLACQLTGEIVSLVTDIVSVITELLGIFGHIKSETASTVRKCGKVAGLAGKAISTAATGTKTIIEQQQVDKAATILKDDMQRSEELLSFFKPLQELLDTVDQVMEFGLFCKTIDGFEELYTESVALYSGPNPMPSSIPLPADIDSAVNHMPITEREKKKVKEVLTIIYACCMCRDYLFKIVKFRKENPFVLHFSLFSRFCLRALRSSTSSLGRTAARGALLACNSLSANATGKSPSVGGAGGFASLDAAGGSSSSAATSDSSSASGGVIFNAAFVIVDIVKVLATAKELKEKDLESVQQIHEYMKIMKEELKVLTSLQEQRIGPRSENEPETMSKRRKRCLSDESNV